MFLITLVVLSLVLAFNGPPYPLLTDTGLVLTLAAVVTLAPAAVGAWVAHRTLQLLDRHPDYPARGQARYGRGVLVAQFVLGVGQGVLIGLTSWLALCSDVPPLRGLVVLPSLAALTPFIASAVLLWIALYPADRAIRQVALEFYLYRGRPVRPVWPLGSYLAFNLRHQLLFILAPMLLIVLARDLIERYRAPLLRAWPHDFVPDLLLGAAAVLVALLAPLILRYVWITARLPESPLRDRLLRLCEKLRMRCRDILVWRSGGMIVNAAVMGIFAPLRYVLITDAMLEQLEDEKIEAVFGHEAGHVKRHHILFFLLYAFITGSLLTVVSARGRHLDPNSYQLLLAGMSVVIALKWGLLFGWISRRFERQADVFGVRTLALAGVPCTLPCAIHHPTEESPSQRGDPLCSTAAHLFGATLHDVAVLNGIPPEAPSWRHSSIASRSRFVQQLARDPQATARFERTVRRVQWGIGLAALAIGMWAGWEIRIWELFTPLLPRG